MTIIETIERPSAELIQGFKELLRNYDSVTCAISDCMDRFGAMTADMRPLFDGIRLVGTAVTVKALASNLAAAFNAIDLCQPGDIVVIDSHGSVNTAFWGENMTMSAMNRPQCRFDLWIWACQCSYSMRRSSGTSRGYLDYRWKRNRRISKGKCIRNP